MDIIPIDLWRFELAFLVLFRFNPTYFSFIFILMGRVNSTEFIPVLSVKITLHFHSFICVYRSVFVFPGRTTTVITVVSFTAVLVRQLFRYFGLKFGCFCFSCCCDICCLIWVPFYKLAVKFVMSKATHVVVFWLGFGTRVSCPVCSNVCMSVSLLSTHH